MVLNTRTPEAEHVDFTPYILESRGTQSRHADATVQRSRHDVNFDWAPPVCAAKPCFPCIDLTGLTVRAKPKDEYVTKRLENSDKLDTTQRLSNHSTKTQWQARPTRHINVRWQLTTVQTTRTKTMQANWEYPINWLVKGCSGHNNHLWKHPHFVQFLNKDLINSS